MKRTAHRAARDLVGALRRQAVRVGADTPSVRGADWRVAVVASVNAATNTVTTEDGIEVRRWESYIAPAAGDIIGITQSGGGSWGTWGRWASGAGIARSMQSGSVNMSWTNANQSSTNVTFPTPFPTTPSVFVNINSGAGATARWSARAYSAGTNGFTAFLYAADATTLTTATGINVQWFATTL